MPPQQQQQLQQMPPQQQQQMQPQQQQIPQPTLEQQQYYQMQMQLQLQRQQQLQHQLYHQNHPQHTMTINRKIINDKPQNIYNEDNPPPLPPLRNPAKAIPLATIPQAVAVTSQITTVSNSDSVQAIPSLNTADNSIYERDKAIYICSTLRTNSQIKNQTTFNATPATTTKPLPSIINCPLPEIPKEAQNGPREEIYVKRKFLDQNSKFATLKAIPLPKIDALELEQQRKKMGNNSIKKLEKPESEAFPEPPPPLILNEDDKKLLEKDKLVEDLTAVTSTTTTSTNSAATPTTAGASVAVNQNDESSFYAVTEL